MSSANQIAAFGHVTVRSFVNDKVLSPLVDNVAEATHYYVRTVHVTVSLPEGYKYQGVRLSFFRLLETLSGDRLLSESLTLSGK